MRKQGHGKVAGVAPRRQRIYWRVRNRRCGESKLTRRAFVAGRRPCGWARRATAGLPVQRARPGGLARQRKQGHVASGGRAARQRRSALAPFLYRAGTRADFRNFELEVEALARPRANSGVYFHTAYQESGFPQKGFEIQINNSALGRRHVPGAEEDGVALRRAQCVQAARGGRCMVQAERAGARKNVQVRLDGALLVDFQEPSPPVLAEGSERGRFLDHGTFALQGHDPGRRCGSGRSGCGRSPTTAGAGGAAPAARRDVPPHPQPGRAQLPDGGLPRAPQDGADDRAGAREIEARRHPVRHRVNCGRGHAVETDEGARKFFESMRGQPVFIAMQAEGREWTQMFSRQTAARFDYIFTDSMTWTDNRGKRMRLWIPQEVGTIADPQEFMDTLVERAVGIFDKEPVDIYVNPTFLRMSWRRTTTGCDRGEDEQGDPRGVPQRGGDRDQQPVPAAVAGVHPAGEGGGLQFTFGTNNAGADDLKRCEYGLEAVEACKLGWQDFFVPGPSDRGRSSGRARPLRAS